MIIEFFVENFRSIRKRQSFSMTKGVGSDNPNNFFDLELPNKESLLTTAAIYGANAAGKSNFILALKAMEIIVINSAKESQRGERLPIKPFRLCKESKKSPTEFEIVFVVDGIKFQYGFALNDHQILDEWLFAYPKGRPQRWFIRAYDEETKEYHWDFSSHFQGKKQLWKESTKPNSLFLSTAVMLNSEQLKPVYDWFDNTIRVAGISGWGPSFTAGLCKKAESKDEVLKFLSAADLDISDVHVEEKTIDKGFFPDSMSPELKEQLLADLGDHQIVDIQTVHKDYDGDDEYFDLDDESDGTRKLFSFAGPWIDTLKNGRVLFIDELHDSLHPQMVKFLIELFHNPKTNPKNAQLVFTTHETSVLDQDVFRRDQVWFCSKSSEQSTTLYPLTDFSARKGTENLEKSYLSGRFGALPITSNLHLLGE
ncbi:AAA family ATPase [Vibrio cortegadensis]|uniref:AAA family ATPase n=1 Tax=Vibrio cortegadensis TaxID=1328770 RepID=UPI00352C6254